MAEPSTAEDERAPLLQLNAPADDEERASRRGSIGGDDFDRRSIVDVLKNPRLLTWFEQLLVILAVVLLCLAAIFGGLALGAHDQLRHRDDRPRNQPPAVTSTKYATTTMISTTTVGAGVPAPTGKPPKESPSKNDEICLTPTCVQISAAILDSIDPSIDPCDDFYQFANGGWLAAHPIPPAKGLFGAAQWIDQRNKDLLLRILETPVDELLDSLEAGDEDSRSADKQNLKDLNAFFGMCMDEDALDRRGSEPLLKVVKEVVGTFRSKQHLKDHKGSDKWQALTETLLLLHSKGIDALFETSAEGDYREDPSMLRLWLTQSGLGLPNPDYYSDSAVEMIYVEVMRSAVSDVYKQLGDSRFASESQEKKKKGKKGKTEPSFDFNKVFEFEKALAAQFADSVDLEDPVLAYNAYNLTELHKLAPLIDWKDYFSGFAPRQIPSPAIVTAPGFFGNLTEIVSKQDDETLEAYFVWKTIQSLGALLGPRERARKEVAQLQNYLSGIDSGVRPSRQDVCLQSLLDNYGFMVGRYFVARAFSGDSKSYAETVIRSTIQAFKDRLPELDWLDPSSRAAAEEKADAVSVNIGWATSPNVTDPRALAAYYASVRPEKGKFFETVSAGRTMEERRKWFSIAKKRDPGVWEMDPITVNAYYQPQQNGMFFPAGVLQAPYFSKDYPEYLGFGSMASLAGHELTHAFDSAGRQFDKTGKLTDWWTNDTIARYNKLTDCIVDQYAGYYVTGPDGKHYHINSKFTLGEDIADGGGLAQTFRAWQDRFVSDKKGDKYENYVLPGLNYTREQLFFIQFARGWARNIKPAESVRRIRVDEHSPTKFRVIGPLSNSEEFTKAFNCPAKSRMNRKHKCHIW